MRFLFCSDDSRTIVDFRVHQGHSGRNLMQDNFVIQRILPTFLPHWICVKSSFYHQFWINIWRSEFKQETDSIFSSQLILEIKVTRILKRFVWGYHVVHNSCTNAWKNIKMRYIGSTSILWSGKDWHSVKLDRMQLIFMEHFKLVAFQKLVDWRFFETGNSSTFIWRQQESQCWADSW